MKRFSSSQIGIQQGSRMLFSDFADGGVMWTGTGERESRHAVNFTEPFLEPPSVMVSASMWDIDHKHNARMDLRAERITANGFELVFRTWQDSRVARVRADWIALGATRDDDDWDVT
jgi:hypothetical protein